jgi:hypothetical protein
VVAQSLLRQAADRGVTICFADLDGADGLWVPEERTVLVNRGLSEAKVAEVIEHELAHVMIDDQHADLDSGKEVLVGQPTSVPGRRREMVALAAALGLVAVVGGVMYGIHTARGPGKIDRVAPNPDPGLIASESGYPKPSLSPSRGPDGRIVYVTVYPTPPAPSGLGSPLDLPRLSPTATKPVPTRTVVGVGTTPAPQPSQPPATSPAPPPPPVQTTQQPPPQTTPTPDPTSAVPSPPDQSAGAGGTGDTGGVGGTDNAPVGTDPPSVADASAVVPAGAPTAP